jgi:uncharacterized protein YqeY
MSLKKTLEDNLKQAMREKDQIKLNALRLSISSIKLAEVEAGKPLENLAIFAVLQKEIKTREETISEAEKAGRPEMVAPIQAEIDYLKEYLPKKLSDAELTDLVKVVIEETGAAEMKDMGKVMKMAIEKAAGRAANDRISKTARELLSSE